MNSHACMTACTVGLQVRKPQALRRQSNGFVLASHRAGHNSLWATDGNIVGSKRFENLNGTERVKFGTNNRGV